MKALLKTGLLSLAAALLATTAMATEYTNGVVQKVDTKTQKVTIAHDELKNLEMPAMTMVFRTANAEILNKMKAGAKIQFVADRVNGKLTVIELK